MTNISLSISHTPWIPERVESFGRLMSQLGLSKMLQEATQGASGFLGPQVREAGWTSLTLVMDRAPNWQWSERMWSTPLALNAGQQEIGADWHLFLQDDVQVAPRFREWLDAMLAGLDRPAVICLESVHPAAQLLSETGARWYTTRDGMVGVGYLLPTAELEDFLRWRSTELAPGAVERINEDTLLGLWCLVTGRKIWSPLPTPIDHDVSLKSVYGNDNHRNRRPLVRWDTISPVNGAPWLEEDVLDPEFWEPRSTDPHLGIWPMWGMPKLAREAVVGYSQARFEEDIADNGHKDIARRIIGERRCIFCTEPAADTIGSALTGVRLCRKCIVDSAERAIMG